MASWVDSVSQRAFPRTQAAQAAAPAQAADPSTHPDAAPLLTAKLADIRARVARGEKVRVVFDIDNTLMDTRYRTLAAAQAFGRAHGITALAGATMDDIRVDGTATAAHLRLPASVADAFQKHWLDFFWRPATMLLDRPIAAVVKLARQAKAAGAEVVYLTGRIEQYRAVTTQQLRAAGLPDVDATHLHHKPGLHERTAPYKERILGELDRTTHVAWYMTEGRWDTQHLQKTVPRPTYVLLDFPVEPKDIAIAPHTPIWRPL